MPIGFVAAAVVAAGQLPPGNSCLPSAEQQRPEVSRPVGMLDLIGLADIGPNAELLSGPTPLDLSPDGKHLALQLRRADPVSNRYCLALMIVPADGNGEPRAVDLGDELLREPSRNRGLALGLTGLATTVTPAWSPDGSHLALLVSEGGKVRVRIVAPFGTLRESVDVGDAIPREVRWTPDGRVLVVAVDQGLTPQLDALEREGRGGYLFDDRFWTLSRSKPVPTVAGAAPSYISIDLASMRHRPALSAEQRLFAIDEAVPPGAQLRASGTSPGDHAWIEAVDRRWLAPTRLRVRIAGHDRVCDLPVCGDGVAGLWWRGHDLLILRHDYPARRGMMQLYRWSSEEPRPRRILDTMALLTGCVPERAGLICVSESAKRPRHLVRIDARTGVTRELYDPNRWFRSRRLSAVRPLHWTDAYGARSFGQLVLPGGYVPGRSYPLVVTSYQARGFLRGATGDEYPIHLLAKAGFAVLAWQQTRPENGDPAATTMDQYQRAAARNADLRRRLLAQVEAGVDAVVALGIADPDRVGISGLSDGASGACFALINSTRFKVASISSGCEDPETSWAMIGPRYASNIAAWGYPAPEDRSEDYWRFTSLYRNAARMTAPILIQSPDSEYRTALQSVEALRRHGGSVEMYVFPDEEHFKWQPAHRAAIYRRNIEWFDFWLRDVEHRSADTEAQYARWRAMKAGRGPAVVTPTPPPNPPRPQAP